MAAPRIAHKVESCLLSRTEDSGCSCSWVSGTHHPSASTFSATLSIPLNFTLSTPSHSNQTSKQPSTSTDRPVGTGSFSTTDTGVETPGTSRADMETDAAPRL
ncbi:hypothetical protein B0T14DRAFT_526791 [Immersiella caudata]|uniref:Uncharacterized protein n=1 Tax=Immersiella caudata TaxID=314043 RepID=A0AA40BU40_9PEZI|nr:hypothetical protein B0T14DRAFT_526791 [Immersiella caudata]